MFNAIIEINKAIEPLFVKTTYLTFNILEIIFSSALQFGPSLIFLFLRSILYSI